MTTDRCVPGKGLIRSILTYNAAIVTGAENGPGKQNVNIMNVGRYWQGTGEVVGYVTRCGRGI